MIFPLRLGRRAGEWLREQGPEGDVAMSTRVRLARNIEGFAFSSKLQPKEALRLSQLLRKKILLASRPQRFQYINLGELDPVWRRVLVERHLISREHAHRNPSHGVAIGAEEITSVMINEEDHLRIQILRSGFRAQDSLRKALDLDKKIARRIPYSFSPDFGYLTSCPTNAGTGLRISVMLHLPALVIKSQMNSLIRQCQRVGIEVRGFFGEGTRAQGDLFQFSNRITLGVSETDILDLVESKVHAVIQTEREARESLLGTDSILIQARELVDRCTSSQTVSTTQTMAALSLLRMGIHLGVFRQLPLARINELFLWTQPGHLQQLVGRSLNRRERDGIRAQLVKRWCARHLPRR